MIILNSKDGTIKKVVSEFYNYEFNRKTGEFKRWGKTFEDDPKVGPLEICDIEVDTECDGPDGVPCGFCYKGNNRSGEHMSFETFKTIFDKLPRTLTQIAFGIGNLSANIDLVSMFDYCRNNDHNPGVIPNLTINGARLTDEWVSILAKHLGGVAVSMYQPKDICYNAVEKLVNAGIEQVNVHVLVSSETYDQCMEVIEDAKSDPRLKGLKAIMFLTLKPKGVRNKNRIIKDVSRYRELIDKAFEYGINIGFDSCTAPIFLMAMKDHPNFKNFSMLSESCEADRFSGYIDVTGKWWHCSFTEGQPGWKSVDMLKINDFNREVWQSEEVKRFRNKLISQDNLHIDKEVYLCPIYDLYNTEIGNASDTVYDESVSDKAEKRVIQLKEV